MDITVPNNILLLFILQTGSVIIGSFLFSYLKKKGSNWADKKDLPEMTQTLESIKAGHSISSDKKMQLFKEEKEELISLGTQITKFLFESSRIDLTEYDLQKIGQLSELVNKLKNEHNAIIYSSTKISMLVLNEDVIKSVNNAQNSTSKWFYLLESSINEYKWAIDFTIKEANETLSTKSELEKQIFYDFQAISLKRSAEKLQETLDNAHNNTIQDLTISLGLFNKTVKEYFHS